MVLPDNVLIAVESVLQSRDLELLGPRFAALRFYANLHLFYDVTVSVIRQGNRLTRPDGILLQNQ